MAGVDTSWSICDVCGNEKPLAVAVCPFCGQKGDFSADGKTIKKTFVARTINLETGRPVVEVALNRMAAVINDSNLNGVAVLTLIHGYGSSGKGGVIRTECRKMLAYMKSKGTIRDYIPGEDFNNRSGLVKALLKRYPKLQKDNNLNRNNRGVTLVVMS